MIAEPTSPLLCMDSEAQLRTDTYVANSRKLKFVHFLLAFGGMLPSMENRVIFSRVYSFAVAMALLVFFVMGILFFVAAGSSSVLGFSFMAWVLLMTGNFAVFVLGIRWRQRCSTLSHLLDFLNVLSSEELHVHALRKFESVSFAFAVGIAMLTVVQMLLFIVFIAIGASFSIGDESSIEKGSPASIVVLVLTYLSFIPTAMCWMMPLAVLVGAFAALQAVASFWNSVPDSDYALTKLRLLSLAVQAASRKFGLLSFTSLLLTGLTTIFLAVATVSELLTSRSRNSNGSQGTFSGLLVLWFVSSAVYFGLVMWCGSSVGNEARNIVKRLIDGDDIDPLVINKVVHCDALGRYTFVAIGVELTRSRFFQFSSLVLTYTILVVNLGALQ
jgi:hypothetical protein